MVQFSPHGSNDTPMPLKGECSWSQDQQDNPSSSNLPHINLHHIQIIIILYGFKAVSFVCFLRELAYILFMISLMSTASFLLYLVPKMHIILEDIILRAH